jgi:hypothetical protein
MPVRIDVVATPAARSARWSKYAESETSTARPWGDSSWGDNSWGRMRHLDEAAGWRHLLDRYLEGWAEANPSKIIAGTAPGYRFDDPHVGRFSRWSIPSYLEGVQGRFARIDGCPKQDTAFIISGPMAGPPRLGRLMFFREAPLLGLTGVTLITIGELGVIAEAVSYDLNPALDVLRDRYRKSE